jgi:hypothetical protein
MTTSDLPPAAVGPGSFTGERAMPKEPAFVVTAFFTTPPTALCFLMRYFVSGLTSGPVKS